MFVISLCVDPSDLWGQTLTHLPGVCQHRDAAGCTSPDTQHRPVQPQHIWNNQTTPSQSSIQKNTALQVCATATTQHVHDTQVCDAGVVWRRVVTEVIYIERRVQVESQGAGVHQTKPYMRVINESETRHSRKLTESDIISESMTTFHQKYTEFIKSNIWLKIKWAASNTVQCLTSYKKWPRHRSLSF